MGRGAGRDRRAARRDRRARSPAHPSLQLRGHDGLGAGRGDGFALLPPARRIAAGTHDLLERRPRRPRIHAGRRSGDGHRALRRLEADPDLGHEFGHVQPALLEHRPGGEAQGREARRHRPVSQRHRDEVRPPRGAAAGHGRGACARDRAGADHREPAGPRLHRAPHAGLRRAARARAAVPAGAGRRDLRDRGPRGGRPGARVRGHAARRDSRRLRPAAHTRRRQRGARDRRPAGADRRLARRGRRGAAVDQRPLSGRPGGADAPRPDAGLAGEAAAHRQHGADRRRAARGRAADRGGGGLQLEPGGRGAGVGEGDPRLPARGPVHRGARALPDRHRRPRRLRAAGDDPARALRPAQDLRSPLRGGEQPRDRAGRPGAAELADLQGTRARGWDSTTPVLRRATRRSRRPR